MTRARIASFLLGLDALAFTVFAVAFAFDGEAVFGLLPLALAGVHGALAVGTARDRGWARWLGMGVAGFWTLLACAVGLSIDLFAATDVAFLGAVIGVHGALVVLLSRPDDTHPRVATSLLLAGLALIPLLVLGVSEVVGGLMGGRTSWWELSAAGLALAGTLGLARSRTWGLLAVGAGGLALGATALCPSSLGHACGCGSPMAMVGFLVLAAALPFAGPVVRFLRAP
jgi:hypothetical protein